MTDLLSRMDVLTAAVRDFHWMARRYADERSSYAPNMFNKHTRACLSIGISFRDALFARDGMGRAFDRLTDGEAAAAERDMPKGMRGNVWRDEEMADLRKRLSEALEAIRFTEELDMRDDCPNCKGHGQPEECERCFPLADARLKRRAVLERNGQ